MNASSLSLRRLGHPLAHPALIDATVNEAAATVAPPVNPELVRAAEIPAAKKAGSNFLEILIFRGLTTPLALALVVLQGRFLAPDGRGRFVLAVLTVSIFSRLLSQLGVAVANHMSSKQWDEPRELRLLVLRSMCLSVVLGVVGGTAVVGIGVITPSVGASTAAVAAIALVPNVIWQTASGVLLGLGRIRPWNYIQLASPLITFAGTLLLVVATHGQVKAALVAWTAAHFLTAALAIWLTRDVWRPFALEPLLDGSSRNLMRLALTMGAMQVLALVGYRSELFVLEALRGVGAVGVYSVANQASESTWVVAAAIATAITASVVHESAADASRLVRRSVLKALIYTGAVAAAVALAARFVIPIALGTSFRGAVAPLTLLLPGAVVYAPVQVIVVFLSVRLGRASWSLAAGLVAMCVTITGAFPLIHAFGAAGAGAASAIGYGCGAVVAWMMFQRLAARQP